MSKAKIPQEIWDDLSASQKKDLENFFDTPGPVDGASGLDVDPQLSWEPIGDLCRAKCDVTFTTIKATCLSLPAPLYPVCIREADKTLKNCKSNC